MKTILSLFVLALSILLLTFGSSVYVPAGLCCCLFESQTRTTCAEYEESHVCEDIVTSRRIYNPPHLVLTGQEYASQEYITARFNTLLVIFFKALRN